MDVLMHRWIFRFLYISLLITISSIETRAFVQRDSNSSSVGHNDESSRLVNATGKDTSKGIEENLKLERDNIQDDSMLNSTLDGNLNGNMGSPGIVTNRVLNNKFEYRLPQIWSHICEVVEGEIYESEFTPRMNLTSLKCTIDANYSNIWRMTDLKENLDIYKNLNLNFSIEIKCHPMANISISFPFKISNLIVLKIRGCRIYNYFTDERSNFLETIQDSLRVVQVVDTTVNILQSDQREFMNNIRPRTKQNICLHAKTVEEIVMRNVSYDYIRGNAIDVQDDGTGSLDPNSFLHSRRISDVCDYLHLVSLDISIRTKPFFDHLHLLTDRSIFENVRIYNASSTGIRELNDRYLQWSKTFPNLQILDLSKNNITKLHRFAFPLHFNLNESKVTTVDLTLNKIATITVSDLERFKEMPMVFFSLEKNPIDCNCSDSFEDLLNYIKQGKHLQISNLSDYSFIEDLECNSPENLKGTTLVTLTSEMICEFEVQTEYFLVPIICLSTAIVILALLLFMVLRFRHEITIILFTRFNIVIPCQTRDSYDSKKKYDAFVSYSSNEEEFVEKLFEDLENPADDKSRPSFKFCMHHRDFVPGKTIFDNVTFSVESSRHTIILLSNHFLKSEYCLYEFQEAFRQSIMEKRRHLVIIMMEDIPEEKLPRDLRRCIKTFTYIRKNDFLFTERLVYALSIKHKRKTVKTSEQ